MKDAQGYYDIPHVGKLPSVTTILQVINKGVHLLKWYEANGTKKAFKLLNDLKAIAPGVHETLLKDLPEDFFHSGSEKLKDAASIGSTAHMYFDHWMKGLKWNIEDVPPRIKSLAEAFLASVGKEKFEVIKSESTVYSKKYQYAGTLDAIIKTEDGRVILRDWKTSNAIYPEHSIQTVAYLYACRELTGEKIDEIEIYRFDKTGRLFDPATDILRVSPERFEPLFETFLHAYELWKWAHG
jgi:hypothetical protein